jgi:hypothetical protein
MARVGRPGTELGVGEVPKRHLRFILSGETAFRRSSNFTDRRTEGAIGRASENAARHDSAFGFLYKSMPLHRRTQRACKSANRVDSAKIRAAVASTR